MAEGPFSENGKPNFFSSTGEEWRILGEGFTTGILSLTRGRFFLHSPFSEQATKGCHTFIHGEAILLAPLFPHSPFSENPFSDLREGVTTPIVTHDRCEKESQWYDIFQISCGSEEDMVICHDPYPAAFCVLKTLKKNGMNTSSRGGKSPF
jgi:hypothetical protein